MGKIASVDEGRRVLDCLSPSLIKTLVAITMGDIKVSKDLAEAVGISLRNAQRIISLLEQMGLIKTMRYGRSKIILSINKYVEKEIIEGIEKLVPYVIDELRIDLSKPDRSAHVIARRIVENLGINVNPSRTRSIVKKVIQSSLERKPLPQWLKRITTTYYEHRLRTLSDRAQQPPRLSDEELIEVVYPGAP